MLSGQQGSWRGRKGRARGGLEAAPCLGFDFILDFVQDTESRKGWLRTLSKNEVLPTDRASGNETPEPFLDGITEGIAGVGSHQQPGVRMWDYTHTELGTPAETSSLPQCH